MSDLTANESKNGLDFDDEWPRLCRTTHNVHRLLLARKVEADTRPMTARELTSYHRKLPPEFQPCPLRTLQDWLARGRLAPVGLRDGDPLYSWVDVHLLAIQKPQKGATGGAAHLSERLKESVTTFVVVCDGRTGDKHQQVQLTKLIDGVLIPRPGRGRAVLSEETGRVKMVCPIPSCRLAASVTTEKARSVGEFFANNPLLTIDREIPERFKGKSCQRTGWRAIRLETVIRILARVRGAA